MVNKDGLAVALMSGGFFSASTDIFLPLDRPLRALQALQSGQIISRGTIQSHWESEKPADCHARGLSDQVIQKYSPDGSGLLVAKMILPGGPSHAEVMEGDVLLEVNGENVTSLSRFEDLMDDAIGDVINVRVKRHQDDRELVLKVQDLFQLTPHRILQFAGSTFHDLRYYTAFRYNVPINGVVLANAEGSFELDDGYKLICSLNNQPTPDLDAFIKVAQGIPGEYRSFACEMAVLTRSDRTKTAVAYRNLDDPSNAFYATIVVDRHWLRARMLLLVRNENIASWSIKDLGPAPPVVPPVNQVLPSGPATECHHAVRKIVPNLVEVQTTIPYKTNGAPHEKKTFLGLVISATAGFVVIPRSFNPSDLCDLSVVFRDLIELPARMVYEHALGFAVIQYDTSLVQGAIGSVTFSKRKLQVGDKTTIYGLNRDGSGPCAVNTAVTSIESLTGEYEPERSYHPLNVEVLHLHKDFICDAGVLLDDDGDVEALWLPFLTVPVETHVGVQVSLLMPALEKLQQGILPPECRMLEVELAKVRKSDVQVFGVSKGMILLRIVQGFWLIHHKDTIENFPHRKFIRVAKVSCSQEQTGLAAGDILLMLGDNAVTQMSDLRDMFTLENLSMSVIRNRTEIRVNVPTVATSRRSDRVVWFSGAQLEPPHFPLPLCARQLYSQIFVTSWRSGSPAEMYNLSVHHFITGVNGVATEDLDSFTNEIKKLAGNSYCQINLVSLQGVTRTVSLMPNWRDFKTIDARRKEKPQTWEFQEF